jgi:dihydrofolate reductase
VRKLIASTFVSLDGVMQSPGGPQEDPTGGFDLGGWQFGYWAKDEDLDLGGSGFDGAERELVLGRKTYEIFAAYWPYQAEDMPIARTFNATRKYVASRTLRRLDWNNSTLLGDDVAAAIAALKAGPGPDLQIIGSGNLIQSLHAASLIDEYNVWTYPLVLGRGKRLFEEGAKPAALRLVRTSTGRSGVVMSVYAPDGEVQAGSFMPDEPSQREAERRAKWAADER